ncbi:hypothetical protein [Pseudobacteriovorax antillogorgiicola]|uniref:Uncharacterized protein n=1 Tax=Pseudobacteriovorax antillogorgiicola TaxID=1513793 RepID=A0A1Y6B8H4_9BACT|nr:hypothetical protein [Pseudobacteriovorax antillogorgiicola]TCS59270.1 hypothetical protein EDD56_101175 [Pseudobacteriovorax antillogorgiicola]SME89888.1 hypothetical protein SAMN06296036_101311 [Pseudobacteriovorax antillogorgiicola]
MLEQKLINYISWLSDRGLETPRLFKIPMDEKGQEAATESPPIAADQNLEAPPTPTSSQNFEAPPTLVADIDLKNEADAISSKLLDARHEGLALQAAKTYIIAKGLPESESLQTLTKLIRALRLKDGEFVFHELTDNPDPGAFLDQLESASCQRLIILDEQLSELILDADFHDICQAPQTTAYDIQVMAAPALDRLDPRAKAIFWKGLRQLFKLS